MDGEPTLKTISDQITRLTELLERLLEEDEPAPEQPALDVKASAGARALSADLKALVGSIDQYAANTAALAGRADAAEARLAVIEAERAGAAALAKARADIEAAGVPGDFDARLAAQYQAGGLPGLTAYATAVIETARDLPGAVRDDATHDLPEVAAYSAAGPQALEDARREQAFWNARPASMQSFTLATWLKHNIGAVPASVKE